MLFRKKKEEPKVITVRDSIENANTGFTAKTVREYALDAPDRELYAVTEQIKRDMQQLIDLNGGCVYRNKTLLIHFPENVNEVIYFFKEKGFVVNCIENDAANGKKACDLEVIWDEED